MTGIKKTIPKDLPILTDVVGEPPIGVPTLTEVADDAAPGPTSTPHLNELEAHLASLFEHKLHQHFAAAQQHAIQQALAEFKRELPQLIHDALSAPRKPR